MVFQELFLDQCSIFRQHQKSFQGPSHVLRSAIKLTKEMEKNMQKMLFIFILISNLPMAFASSECSSVSLDKARAAYQILLNHQRGEELPVIDEECLDCHNRNPRAVAITSLGIKATGTNYQVTINDMARSISSLSIRGKNIGAMIQCDSSRSPSQFE